jgi:hypothetical protein
VLRKSSLFLSLAAVLAVSVTARGEAEDVRTDGGFRARARQHFEWMTIDYGDADASYLGLSNTINVWWEKPFDWSFGLAFGPILGSADRRSSTTPGLPETLTLWHLGFEGKYFPLKKLGLFGRAGLFLSVLDPSVGSDVYAGAAYYAGFGWEFQVWKIGIAPELAIRHAWLEGGRSAFVVTPSIGLHFYLFGDNSPKSDQPASSSKESV